MTPPSKIKTLKPVKPQVDQDLVTLLNQAMEAVLSGQIQGIVMLTNNTANEYGYASAGEMQMSEVCNAHEDWVFDQRLRAWKELNQ